VFRFGCYFFVSFSAPRVVDIGHAVTQCAGTVSLLFMLVWLAPHDAGCYWRSHFIGVPGKF
jgi:hypothetical protein